jgi:hypothetical protein
MRMGGVLEISRWEMTRRSQIMGTDPCPLSQSGERDDCVNCLCGAALKTRYNKVQGRLCGECDDHVLKRHYYISDMSLL